MTHSHTENQTFKRVAAAFAIALGSVLVAFPSADLSAEELPESTSLIELRSRVFDMRADAHRIRRDNHFIPIREVKWIDDMIGRDPDLRLTVIHIETTQDGIGRHVWPLDDIDRWHPHSDGIPTVMMLDGYEARWSISRPTGSIGSVFLAPSDSRDYNMSCVYETGDPGPGFCSMIVAYPPDRDIRIKVRIYRRPHHPINDFAEIATKASIIVRCLLDVTEAVEEGRWQQRPHLTPDDDLPKIAECRDFTS